MGQSNQKEKEPQLPTRETIDQNIEILFEDWPNSIKSEVLNESIIIISRILRHEGSFQQREEGFHVNPTLLKCLYHLNFERTIKKLMSLLARQLKAICQTKIIAMVSRQKFRKLLNFANFCIFFLNQRLIETVNLMHGRSDLELESEQLIQSLIKQKPSIQKHILDAFQMEELYKILEIFRNSMGMLIDLHLKLITRSDFTLKITDKLNQSVFVLYTKILFEQHTDVFKRQCNQKSQTVLKMGGYFLGQGIQTKECSVYEIAVLLISQLIKFNPQRLKSAKGLPSHLFKNIPIVSQNQMMNWIVTSLLFVLRLNKQGSKVHCLINVNRISAYKLINLILDHYQPQSSIITYFIEDLCLQTKTHQIDRVYLTQILKKYSSLDDTSEICKKYRQLGNINFNVKGPKNTIKIKPEDVIGQLQDDEESLRKEMVDLCSKYTIQVIFQKRQILYDYSDKALWNLIINNLQTEKINRLEQLQPEVINQFEFGVSQEN